MCQNIQLHLSPLTHVDSHLPKSLHHCQFTPQEPESASQLGPQIHQDAEQFIKPSTWICERELRSVFKMMVVSSLAQNTAVNPHIYFVLHQNQT